VIALLEISINCTTHLAITVKSLLFRLLMSVELIFYAALVGAGLLQTVLILVKLRSEPFHQKQHFGALEGDRVLTDVI
jgi:hypothetical protein